MRISDIPRRNAAVITAALLLAACGAEPAANPFDAPDADRIECGIGVDAPFARDCVVERSTTPDGLVLTVRHPDGGFRRLLVTKDGRGVAAADGAEAAVVTVEGKGGILVAIGEDRYRLPATVKATP